MEKSDTSACVPVTKQHAGIDTHLDILILLDFVFAGHQGFVSLALCY